MMSALKAKERCCWSNLPLDVLEFIASFLFGSDSSCFRAVCKTWRSVSYPIHKILKTNKNFPALVSLKFDTSSIDFFNPILYPSPGISNSVYRKIVARSATNSSSIHEIGEMIDDDEFDESREGGETIRFAKHGWLLISRGKCSVFFFNPITKQRIDLPDLPSTYCFDWICFSTPPTSSDCVVLGMEVPTETDYVNVSFIHHGENAWTEDGVSKHSKFIASFSNPVSHNGYFYFMGNTGNLAIYDPKRCGELDAWRVLDKPEKPCASIRYGYLIECDGKLMSVLTGFMGRSVGVFSLGPSGNWEKEKNLNDKILFVSQVASLSVSANDLQISGLENNIYFPQHDAMDGTGIFYNLGTCKFHSFGGRHTKEDLYNSEYFRSCAWIEPNHHLYTDKELNWLHNEA